jgi:GNAT superfamily N-acetyltransferase
LSAALRLELRPSYGLAAAIVTAHGAAALAMMFLMKDLWGAGLGAALLALGVAAAWSRALLRGRDAVRALELDGGEALVELGDGEKRLAPVAPRRYVSRFLVTLRLGAPLGRTLLVTAGMLERRQFRRLRLWALWGKVPDVAAEQLAG